MQAWDGCVLELTHNHGTEKEEGPQYHNGNTEPKGFGYEILDERSSTLLLNSLWGVILILQAHWISDG